MRPHIAPCCAPRPHGRKVVAVPRGVDIPFTTVVGATPRGTPALYLRGGRVLLPGMKLRTPAEYLLAWVILVVAALIALVAGVPLIAMLLGVVSTVPLFIGCVGQGVKVGMNAHHDDTLREPASRT